MYVFGSSKLNLLEDNKEVNHSKNRCEEIRILLAFISMSYVNIHFDCLQWSRFIP